MGDNNNIIFRSTWMKMLATTNLKKKYLSFWHHKNKIALYDFKMKNFTKVPSLEDIDDVLLQQDVIIQIHQYVNNNRSKIKRKSRKISIKFSQEKIKN